MAVSSTPPLGLRRSRCLSRRRQRGTGFAQLDARMLRQPTVSATQIAFVYGGDIWIMPKAGGTPQRLTTRARRRELPALLARRDADRLHRRLRRQPGRLRRCPPAGGEPDAAHLSPRATIASSRGIPTASRCSSRRRARARRTATTSYSRSRKTAACRRRCRCRTASSRRSPRTARRIAYLPEAVDARTWKRYRGGWAPDIWTFDLTTGAAKNITHDEAQRRRSRCGTARRSTSSPIAARTCAATSGRTTPKTDASARSPNFDDFDVKYPSLGPSDIVFQAGEPACTCSISPPRRRTRCRSRSSPTARRSARTSQDVADRDRRRSHLAHRQARRSSRRTATSSPCRPRTAPCTISPRRRRPPSARRRGRPTASSIAYWSDKTGEYELTLRTADGTGEERTVTKLGAGFRYQPYWSPDSKKIAFIDQAMRIHVVDVATGQVTKRRQGAQLAARQPRRLPRQLVGRQPLDGVLARSAESAQRHLHLRHAHGRRAAPGDERLLQRSLAVVRSRRQVSLLPHRPHVRAVVQRFRQHVGLREQHEHRRRRRCGPTCRRRSRRATTKEAARPRRARRRVDARRRTPRPRT